MGKPPIKTWSRLAWPLVLFLEGQMPSGKNRIGLRITQEKVGLSKVRIPKTMMASRHQLKKPAGISPDSLLKGGKNWKHTSWLRNGKGAGMKVHRFPRTRFETWRTNSAEQLWAQAGKWMPCMPIQIPVILSIHYWPSDARVRDLDGMLSAIGHLLEWTRIVEHDGQIMEVEWHRYASDSDASGIVLVVEPYVADARPSVNLMQLRKSHTMDVKALQELFAARGFRTTHAEALSRVLSTACPSTSHALG